MVWEGLLEEASSELGPEGRTGGRGHGDPGLWSEGLAPACTWALVWVTLDLGCDGTHRPGSCPSPSPPPLPSPWTPLPLPCELSPSCPGLRPHRGPPRCEHRKMADTARPSGPACPRPQGSSPTSDDPAGRASAGAGSAGPGAGHLQGDPSVRLASRVVGRGAARSPGGCLTVRHGACAPTGNQTATFRCTGAAPPMGHGPGRGVACSPSPGVRGQRPLRGPVLGRV